MMATPLRANVENAQYAKVLSEEDQTNDFVVLLAKPTITEDLKRQLEKSPKRSISFSIAIDPSC